MNTNSQRILLLTLVIAFLTAAASFAATDSSTGRQRGFMFEIGAGPTTLSYGAVTDSYFSAAVAAGASRVQVYINIDLGYAVTQKLYLVAGVDGVGDSFYDPSYYIQINSYLYHGGFRYYPFETGLVLGLDAGAAMMMVTSDLGLSGTSPTGWGGGAIVGYDFARRLTGFGLELGVAVDYLTIQGSPTTAAALFLDLLWK